MISKRIYPSLKAWRDAQGLTQADAARQLGIQQPYYSRLERGQSYPHRELAKKISDVTGVALETVLGVA